MKTNDDILNAVNNLCNEIDLITLIPLLAESLREQLRIGTLPGDDPEHEEDNADFNIELDSIEGIDNLLAYAADLCSQ